MKKWLHRIAALFLGMHPSSRQVEPMLACVPGNYLE